MKKSSVVWTFSIAGHPDRKGRRLRDQHRLPRKLLDGETLPTFRRRSSSSSAQVCREVKKKFVCRQLVGHVGVEEPTCSSSSPLFMLYIKVTYASLRSKVFWALGSGCSASKELMPHDPGVMGSNPRWVLGFFLLTL